MFVNNILWGTVVWQQKLTNLKNIICLGTTSDSLAKGPPHCAQTV